jgi:hypothetical protein
MLLPIVHDKTLNRRREWPQAVAADEPGTGRGDLSIMPSYRSRSLASL